ncbi:MAG TPA: hypothetical protein VFS32_09620 [Candidatus Limnocylindrales bacterium]|nr:hypothetical protein [Candidatus Limnocylindrales bacterium]
MSGASDIERTLDRWLGGPDDRLPDGALDAALSRIDATSQRRSWPGAWRSLRRPSVRMALLAGGAVLALAGVLGAGGLNFAPPAVQASPTPSRTAPMESARASKAEHSGTIIFESYGGSAVSGVFAVRAAGGDPWRLGPIGACCGVLSPTGSQVALSVPGAGDQRVSGVVRLDGGDYETLQAPATASTSVEPGAWADDGRIAYDLRDDRRPGLNGIYLADASSTASLVRLTTAGHRAVDEALAFSPDGLRLLFERVLDTSVQPTRGDLYVIGLDGTGLRRLNPNGLAVTDDFGSPASWSPDGGSIAFAAFNRYGSADVDVVGPDGTLATIAQGGWATSARFSPDGRRVLFDRVVEAGGNHRLFVAHPDGSDATELPYGDGVCCAAWAPDGNAFVLASPGLTLLEADGVHATKLVSPSGEIVVGHYLWSAAAP